MLRFNWSQPEAHGACIYQQQPYQLMMATRHNAISRCIKITDSTRSLSYLPILVRKIANETTEAFSAHGYGGLYGDAKPLSIADVDELKRFLAESGIHAIFLRHAPFLSNHRFWPEDTLTLNRVTHKVELRPHQNFADYKSKLPQKIRASINHAVRSGFIVERVPREATMREAKCFHALYDLRMRIRDAESFYKFDRSFFAEHTRMLGDACVLMVARSEATGRMVAGAFFLIDREYGHVHYHLSAASEEGMRHQAMELLLSMAIYEFGMEGFKIMHLGGGHKLDETDGLSRFKRKFSTGCLPFYISKIISDPGEYKKLRERLPLRHPSLFLLGDAMGEQ